MTPALAGGTLRVLGVHLHIFPVNYACKNFFHRPAGAPTAPPGYDYVTDLDLWPRELKLLAANSVLIGHNLIKQFCNNILLETEPKRPLGPLAVAMPLRRATLRPK